MRGEVVLGAKGRREGKKMRMLKNSEGRRVVMKRVQRSKNIATAC